MRIDITLALLAVYLFLPNQPILVICSEDGKPNETDQSATSNLAEHSSSDQSVNSKSSSQPDGSQGGSSPPASPTSGTPEPTKAATADMSNKTGVTLDIKNHKKPTDQFEHSKSGKIVTYTAKGENAFNVVKHKDLTIWSTTNNSEYATTVILDGRGKKEKRVSIQLPNNTVKVYYRPEKDKPWSEDTNPSQPTSNKAKTDSSTPVNGFELNIKNSDSSGNDNYDFKESFGKMKIYNIYSGKQCTVVKCEDKEVWKYDSAKTTMGFPTSVKYKENEIIITLTNGYLKFDKENDGWKKDENASTKEKSSNDGNDKTGTGTGQDGSGGGTGTGQQGGKPASGDGTTGGGRRGSGQGGGGSANGKSGKDGTGQSGTN